MKVPHPIKNSSRTIKILAAVSGAVMAGGTAFAVTNWTVGLTNGTNPAGAQAASVSSITVTATTPITDGSTSGTITNLLYPGASGDVVLTISNPNPFPVSISTITTTATGATGYSDANLTAQVPASGCTAANSTVTWAGTAGVHTLNGGTPLVVAAKSGSNNGTLVVTLTNAATMGSAPTTCEGAYFSMAPLSATNAASSTSSTTTSPATAAYNTAG